MVSSHPYFYINICNNYLHERMQTWSRMSSSLMLLLIAIVAILLSSLNVFIIRLLFVCCLFVVMLSPNPLVAEEMTYWGTL